ncbi:MAG: hypothetical protein ACXWZB_03890, partial [Gaiellaceae bacterium]
MKAPQRLVLVLVAVGTLAAMLAASASARHDRGFKTSAPSQLTAVKAGVQITPLLTVGETLPGGYVFESIPDGIAIDARGHGGDDDDDDDERKAVDVYVNHETSTVPFPFTAPSGPGFNDFTNAMVSKLSVSTKGGGILSGSYVIPSSANYQRFCSNFIATKKHGFKRDILFANEEATDWVFRTGTAVPGPGLVPPGTPGAEQAGVVVAYDLKSGAYKTIYGMGRHNHENSVAIPGYGEPVVLSGDDTFSAPASQLYLYNANSSDDLWADKGALYAFKADDPAKNDYGDLSGTQTATGRFIPVPEAIAKGDQNGLEAWSNANNVFQFIRVEDIAYDRKRSNVVYFADTGEPRAVPNPDATGRLSRGASSFRGPYPNGRIFKLVLDKRNPLLTATLSILIDADTGGYGNVNVIHQPDNVETTRSKLLIQEDPGSHNQGQTTARIWSYDFRDGTLEVIAKVDQSQRPATALGAWESSGIIDASKEFGKGAFLVDVQAGSLVVQSELRGNITYEREGGQLLLIRVPDGDRDDDDDEDED